MDFSQCLFKNVFDSELSGGGRVGWGLLSPHCSAMPVKGCDLASLQLFELRHIIL